jgi:hypothetical protein
MQRIDGPGATPENMFTEGNPALGIAATTVTANWMNGVQEELIHILEEAGLTPDEATLTQVLSALRLLFVRKDVPEGVTARSLLELTALTGSLPANGVFSYGALRASESTVTTPGSADNVMTLVANAYWDGTQWRRRASGTALALEFRPASNQVCLRRGEDGIPDVVILWEDSVSWLLTSGTSTELVDKLTTLSITPTVLTTAFLPSTASITTNMTVKKMPDNTLHIAGNVSKTDTTTFASGDARVYLAGNPLGLTAGELTWGICLEGPSTTTAYAITYDSGQSKTLLKLYSAWDASNHSMQIFSVLPCVGI